MRINKFVARAAGVSRRTADGIIGQDRVTANGQPVKPGYAVSKGDAITIDGTEHSADSVIAGAPAMTVMLHKPTGFVVSRDGQGSKTIYDLLPPRYQHLNPIGRLDKDSSGLLLLTDDGELANRLTHPRYQKVKVYEVTLDKPLQPLHRQMISDHGLQLDDGPSRLQLERLADGDDRRWSVIMREGRNRQIRRTFAALGYKVERLHRTVFGTYRLGTLASGQWQTPDS